MRKSLLFFAIIGCFAKSLQAQQAIVDSNDSMVTSQLDDVVVTATRTEQNLQDASSPITIITAKQIKDKALVRLDEVLAEYAGLPVQYDAHGNGVQIQGLDPAYTLILMDGLPLIGRTTGIFELSRISTDNIERIEIVKGPSSCLYGSEAMAGVINIITKRPVDGFSGNLSGRYGTFNTSNLSVNTGFRKDKLFVTVFADRYSSNGYTLGSSKIPTVSPYSNYTFNTKAGYTLGSKTDLSLSLRYYSGRQQNEALVDTRFTKGNATEEDINIAPVITHRFSDRLKSTLQLYRSTYKTKSQLNYTDDGSTYDTNFFNQALNRAELQNDFKLSKNVLITAGLGGQNEAVKATRYVRKEVFNSGYGYAQVDWRATDKLSIVAGGRYDAHNAYKSQFSPKISASYSLNPRFTVLASAGRGYKSPDFRQLYLNFTNPVVGYTVLGYEVAAAGIEDLKRAGMIKSILMDVSKLNRLDAETSDAYNLGFRWKASEQIGITANAFRNNINNLIESTAIAIKTNDESVFSYFNLRKVYTEGVEVGINWEPIRNIKLSGNFQYLTANDKDVLGQIADKKIFARDPATNTTSIVTRAEYGGLFNRSKYTWNVGLGHEWKKLGITSSLRAIYRGKYGYKDVDGNGILNLSEEYTNGFMMLNMAVSKSFFNNKFGVQLSAQNLLNYTSPTVILNLPGRLLYAGITYNF